MNIDKLLDQAMISIQSNRKNDIKKSLKDRILQLTDFKLHSTEAVRSRNNQVDLMREDKVEPSLSKDDIFMNTDFDEYSYFKVDTYVEEE